MLADYQAASSCAAAAAPHLRAPDGVARRVSGRRTASQVRVTLTYGARTVRLVCGTRRGVQDRVEIDPGEIRIAGQPARPGWLYDVRRRRWVEAINSVEP